MNRTIGILAADHVATAVVESNRIAGALRRKPDGPDEIRTEMLKGMPAEAVAHLIAEEIEAAANGDQIHAVGVAVPGIIRDGVILESPNLPQLKGFNLRAALPHPRVLICNDADAMAAGIAATRGLLDRLIRVWTLGVGIGFGRYPWTEGMWEGGHSVVTLDPRERYCGCGGVGHLEGILGHRAMRLRFLDLEPDEVFENARAGEARCADFVKLGHRALAAATATSIHMDGPGKFFITGPNARHIDPELLNLYLHDMVKMSPLQGSVFEIITTTDEIGVIGASVNASAAA